MTQRASGQKSHNTQLDLLRATAILMVVIYHICQMSPKPLPALMRFMRDMPDGVELSFILSGWLIGGLYWKEYARYGDVHLWRFWARRWMRTIPPYLAALGLAWGAVRMERHEPFNWGYLCFIQNYYYHLPYFLVSWSLCIEEHFYLFLPLLLIWGRGRPRFMAMGFALLMLAAPVCRCWLSRDGIIPGTGFELTATHLRLEALIFGFSAAYVSVFVTSGWQYLRWFSRWAGTASVAILLVILMTRSELWMYRIGLTARAAILMAALLWLVERKPGRIAASGLTKAIAISSYSIYLTHALVLHVARVITNGVPASLWFIYFPIAMLVIAAAGAAFHFTIGSPSIQLRDRFVPRRKGVVIGVVEPQQTESQQPAASSCHQSATHRLESAD
jgi:peptidoglycan/LPS O-acetylase OafA/YrhL